MTKLHDLSSVRLGWVMTDEAAQEGNLPYAMRLTLAIVWSEGFAHAFETKADAEVRAADELTRLSAQYPHVAQTLEFLQKWIQRPRTSEVTQ